LPFLNGGAQERGRRASTENVPGIVGFGKAAELAGQEINSEAERITVSVTNSLPVFKKISTMSISTAPRKTAAE